MNRYLLVFLVLVASCFGQAWTGVLDPSRATNWMLSGMPATLPNGETTANAWTPPAGRTQCVTSACNTVLANAGSSTPAQINAAIASAPHKSYVLLPAGTYTLNGLNNCFGSTTTCIVLYGNNYVTLRGSGPMSTIINFTETNAEFQFGTCCSGTALGFLSSTSYSKGTSNVSITGVSSTSALVPGNLGWLTQCNTFMSFCGTVNVTGTGTTVTETSGQPFTSAMIGQTIIIATATGGGFSTSSFTVASVASQTVLTLSTAATVINNVPAYIGANAFTDSWPSGPTPLLVCGRDYPFCTSQSTLAQATGPFNWMQQNVEITAASCTANCGGGNQTWSVTFTPPLESSDWSSNNDATLSWQNTAGTSIGMGLENMTVNWTANKFERIDASGYANWVEGLRVVGYPSTSSIQLGQSLNFLLKNNYFFANNFNNFNNNIGEPIVLGSGATHALLINNINIGGLGNWGEGQNTANVVAFQFNDKAQTPDYQRVFLDHGVYDDLPLIEASQYGRDQSDDTHGTHTRRTRFRNYISGEDEPMILSSNAGLVAVDVENFQRFDNVIGNVLGGPKSTAYQGTGSNVGNVYQIATTDTLTAASLFRWGYWDIISGAVRWCVNATAPCTGSEVPSSLTGNAAGYQNPIPSSHDLPCTFFMSTATGPCSPTTLNVGGSNISFFKVATAWSSFPNSPTAHIIPPFPTAGPELTGGPYGGGHAYDIPAAVAHKSLPNDPAYQGAFSVASASWSGGVETISVDLSTIDNGSPEHTMGAFRLCKTMVADVCTVPAPTACYPTSGLSWTGDYRTDNEMQMRSVTRPGPASTITYFLPVNPGAADCHTGVSFYYPDVRKFDEIIYEMDSSGGGSPQPVSPNSLLAVPN